jgi:peptidoglycan hydrolase CwlO-like protein
MRLPTRSGRGPSTSVARALVGGAIAFLLVGTGVTTSAGASPTASKLAAAKDRLARLEREIAAENAQLRSMQGKLNGLAAEIDATTGAYQRTQLQVMETRDRRDAVQARYDSLRGDLDHRAAYSYMQGAETGLELVLGSQTVNDFTDRLEFLDSVQQHDADLALQVQRLSEQLLERETALNKLLVKRAAAVNRYQIAQSALNAQFQQEKSIRDDLSNKQAQVGSIVKRLQKRLAAQELAAAIAAQQNGGGGVFNIKDNPLHTCPVGNPHAFGDSFGAPRYTTSPPHPHAGEDIMAPRGTPIYATFDGTAEEDPNGLGGNAVIVRGADGYTYNAHLDSYGQLGPVKTGDVIGYVGDSGDARGGATHDHFEWHPNVLPSTLYRSPYGYTNIDGAIDSYPYLLQVC